jgi:hypothetical protein
VSSRRTPALHAFEVLSYHPTRTQLLRVFVAAPTYRHACKYAAAKIPGGYAHRQASGAVAEFGALVEGEFYNWQTRLGGAEMCTVHDWWAWVCRNVLNTAGEHPLYGRKWVPQWVRFGSLDKHHRGRTVPSGFIDLVKELDYVELAE